jgi:putative radical SAM enzyme (TIGR03279 family)
MTAPVVVSVAPGSPAALAGLRPGDEIIRLNGRVPRDVIEWRLGTDEAAVDLQIARHGVELDVEVAKPAGRPLGAEVSSAVFDRIHTCDNHCEFCFIYQLPKGLRRSLYLKDDDYRLSFLYGNFTTLTRFTEADLERVVTEGLSPLHVSIHATDPAVRAAMLRNRRGATSLRWLRALLDHGVEVRGQVVVCPGVNDGRVLDDTFAGVLDEYPELSTLAVVPLGVSKFNPEPALRPHTESEAAAVVDAVEDWQDVYAAALGRRLVHAADEYYLMARRAFPAAERYDGFPMHEDGIGMARTFELELTGAVDAATGIRAGFFAAVDGSAVDPQRGTGPRNPTYYRTTCGAPIVAPPSPAAPRQAAGAKAAVVQLRPRRSAPVGILTGPLGARVLAPLIGGLGRPDVRIVTVANEFFGGNTGVAGLMVGADLARTLTGEPDGHRYLLPDVCLSDDGRFLDGLTVADLPRPVEVVATDGHALRRALDPIRSHP